VTNCHKPQSTLEETQARLREHARHMTADAKWIKLADHWDNMSGMSDWSQKSGERYASTTEVLLEAPKPYPTVPTGAEELARRILDRSRSLLGAG